MKTPFQIQILARHQDSNIRPNATMIDTFSTVEVNMAAEPEVLITSLLKKR